MNQKALLIFNPKSGEDNLPLEELHPKIFYHLKNFELEVFETTGENDSEKIQMKCREVEPDLVLAGGGDGTVKLVAENIPNQTLLAILPLGSANGLAKCLGIDLLEDGLEALRYLNTMEMDGIEINGELCLHLADFGLNANLIEKFEEDGTRGMMGYIKSSLSQLFNSEPQPFRITSGEKSWDIHTRMLLIANGDRYGTGAIINPQGKMDDGKFELVAHEVESLEDLLEVSKSMIGASHSSDKAIRTWVLQDCEIENLNQTNFQIDGELKGKPEKVKVNILPGRFRVVVPNLK